MPSTTFAALLVVNLLCTLPAHTSAMTTRLPTIFVNHGGGPLPLLGDPNHAKLIKFLSSVRHTIPKPSSILVVTAHWEASKPTVSTNPKPPMLYDYGGFPPESYRIQYPAPGSPQLAARVVEVLKAAGIKAGEDSRRGFDHGTFVPLKLMYPDADIPVVQLSLVSSYDPEQHIAIGRALEPLRDEGVLVVGSGLSYHNLPAMFASMRGGGIKSQGGPFDEWLRTSIEGLRGEALHKQLARWASAPGARQSHPSEDHLLPLLVVAGAAGQDQGQINFRDEFLGAHVTGFVFGQQQVNTGQGNGDEL